DCTQLASGFGTRCWKGVGCRVWGVGLVFYTQPPIPNALDRTRRESGRIVSGSPCPYRRPPRGSFSAAVTRRDASFEFRVSSFICFCALAHARATALNLFAPLLTRGLLPLGSFAGHAAIEAHDVALNWAERLQPRAMLAQVFAMQPQRFRVDISAHG